MDLCFDLLIFQFSVCFHILLILADIFLQFVLCAEQFRCHFFIGLDAAGGFQFHFQNPVFLKHGFEQRFVAGDAGIFLRFAFVIINRLFQFFPFRDQSGFFRFQHQQRGTHGLDIAVQFSGIGGKFPEFFRFLLCIRQLFFQGFDLFCQSGAFCKLTF